MIVGIDEAGRGPLAGAVVACALYLNNGEPPFPVKDSKELSVVLREKILAWLATKAEFSVGIATPTEIDKHNILQATFLAFNRAIEGLLKKASYLKEATFIIDGNLFQTDLDIKYICMEKADKKVKEVSCASIVAKVTRDYFMKLADFIYPQWNFSKHKGYPTKDHFSLLKEYPLTPLHRRSFSPCKR
jgi:ribonuclease HII